MSPWAQQYHSPYAHDQMALWGLLKDHRTAGERQKLSHNPFSNLTAYFLTRIAPKANFKYIDVKGHPITVHRFPTLSFPTPGPAKPRRFLWLGNWFPPHGFCPQPFVECVFRILLYAYPDSLPAPPSESPSEFLPAWGRLQFLAPILRPTPESSDDWFSTLKRAGGGCNDLVFSGHMLVAALTAAAFQVRACVRRLIEIRFKSHLEACQILDLVSLGSPWNDDGGHPESGLHRRPPSTPGGIGYKGGPTVRGCASIMLRPLAITRCPFLSCVRRACSEVVASSF